MIELPDFVHHAPVPQRIIELYRDRVPEELVELWQHYGYGSFGGGFVRVIDPELFETAIGDRIGTAAGDMPSIPIMVTAMADVIVWEAGLGVTGLMFRVGESAGLGSRVSTFLKLSVGGGPKHFARRLDWEPYPEAVERHGVPAYDQSFVHVPLLSLGGSRTVDSLQQRQTVTAIELMLDMQGPIER